MYGQFIEKRRIKKDSVKMTNALNKILPIGKIATLKDILGDEARALRDAQNLATTMYNSHVSIPMHLSDNAPRQAYRDRRSLVKPQVHAGQLKLFLSELRFLTEFATKSEKPIKLVYAGAAPGIHLPYLANLFPTVQFVLYDPREFCDDVFTKWNIYVPDRNGSRGIRFNKSLANRMGGEHVDFLGNYTMHIKAYKLLFISDIRSGDSDDPKCDFEKCCQSDMNAQMDWIRIMRPAASMVKFRLPYAPGNTGYLAPIDDEHLWFGVFAPRGSTELRLVTGPECAMRKYDNLAVEERAYYFNNFTRVAQYGGSANIISSSAHLKKIAMGMDNCWDCCAMRKICYTYLSQKYEVGADAPLPEYVERAIILTGSLIPDIAIIITNYSITVTEDELYDFMAAVLRQCRAGDKLHAAPHGGNPKCVPWADIVGPAGFALEPHNSKIPMDRIEHEIRKLYDGAVDKK